MKEQLDSAKMQKQYDDLADIVKEIRVAFPQFKFDHWNSADFSIDIGDDEFMTLDEIQKIDKMLRKRGRNIVLLAPVHRTNPLEESTELEIVTLESSGVHRARLRFRLGKRGKQK